MPHADESDSAFDDLIDVTLESFDALIGHATPVDLTAFSFGGLVAATLASRRPTGKLVLVGSPGHGLPRRTYTMQNWKTAANDDDGLAMLFANLKTFMVHHEAAADRLATLTYARACINTRIRSRGIHQGSPLPRLVQVANTDTMLLRGEHDMTVADLERLCRCFSELTKPYAFHVVPNAGHWAQFESAETVNDWLASFLAAG